MGWDSPDQHYSYLEKLTDTNDDGVPDAFERRATITEILNAPESDAVIVELEGPRPPRTGDVYIMGGEFVRAMVDYPAAHFSFWIVKRFVAGAPPIRDN